MELVSPDCWILLASRLQITKVVGFGKESNIYYVLPFIGPVNISLRFKSVSTGQRSNTVGTMNTAARTSVPTRQYKVSRNKVGRLNYDMRNIWCMRTTTEHHHVRSSYQVTMVSVSGRRHCRSSGFRIRGVRIMAASTDTTARDLHTDNVIQMKGPGSVWSFKEDGTP